jgi:quinol monooxygenase YgiN
MTRRIAAVLVFCVMLAPLAGAQSVPESNPPAKERNTMRYGLSGKMVTKPGQRDAVVAILLRDVDQMKAVGCDLYVVSVSKDHPDAIYITEVWASKEAHAASLKLPCVKQASSRFHSGVSDIIDSFVNVTPRIIEARPALR